MAMSASSMSVVPGLNLSARQLGGLCGVLGVVLFVVGIIYQGETPLVSDPPQEVRPWFVENGWFEPSRRWYLYKALCVLALWVTALWVPGPWLKGLFFGLFIQQAAFIAHDTCHDAAVPRRWRRRVAWWFGSVGFGLNHEKWTREHNLHHMINSRPLEDPQLNNMPDLEYAARAIAPSLTLLARTLRREAGWRKRRARARRSVGSRRRFY